MRISLINKFEFNNLNKNYYLFDKNCSFGSGFCDDLYDTVEGSIFDRMDAKNRNTTVDITEFSLSRKNLGEPVTEEPFKSMKINALRYLGNNCYKGGLASTVNYIKELKNAGISKVTILCDPREGNIMDTCKENNMNTDIIFVPLRKIPDEIDKRDFNNKFSSLSFVNTIKSLREGNVFLGCESGNLRTKRFLFAAKLLDPECKIKLNMADINRGDYIYASWIYEGLTDLKKTVLGYTKEFEDNLLQRFSLRANIIK